MTTKPRVCMSCDSPVGPGAIEIEVCIFEVRADGTRAIAKGLDPVKAPICDGCRPLMVREWSEILDLAKQKGYMP